MLTVPLRTTLHLSRRAALGAFLLAAPKVLAQAPRTYDLPAGEAAEMLQRFAEVSGHETLFSPDMVRGVRTAAVRGDFTPREALTRLLANTGLSVLVDAGTGALAVRRDAMPSARRGLRATLAAAFALTGVAAGAQTAGPATPATDDPKAIVLSPFEVNVAQDQGYTATNTLAGSRLNTALRDTPAAISVFTKDFLDDIGAINVTQALEYSLNGGQNLTDATGNAIVGNDVLVQFRGFTGASLGRNYFGWALSSDSYNIERIDFSRGPNSILFGIGGPGGILNTSTKRARIGSNIQQFRFRSGSYHDQRAELDYGRTLIPGKLAVRTNLLFQDKADWREFVGSTRKGAAFAATWRPLRHTEIRFDGEYGDVNQVITAPWPAQERYLGWVTAGRAISQTYGQAAAGTGANNNRQWIYDPASGLGAISWFGSRVSNTGPTAPGLGNNTAAILDESVLPRDTSIGGPGFRGDYYYYNYALFVEQRVGDFAFEAAFNRQSEQREQFRPQVFNDVALRVDVNAVLPNGRPNPNVGKFYTDGQLQVDLRDQVRDDYRFTGSYDLDLRRRSDWLGRHTFAALWQRRQNEGRNDGLNEVNLTPDGSANYPLDLTNANNMIRRRSYLDFGSANPDRRGLHDPRLNPIRGNGVVSGLVRTRDASQNNLTRTDSKMVAVQSKFLRERVVLTGGLRNDRQRDWASTADLNGNGNLNDDRDPVTRTFPKRIRNARASYSEGDTRTYGVVVHATAWLSVFYNNANNFVPQSDFDINNRFLGNREGEGEDMGIRLSLLDNRISATVARYKTAEVNTAVGRDNAFINSINSIWQTLGRVDLFTDAASRDSQSTKGEGWEYEITANPLPRWRLSANFSDTEQVTSNIQPRNGAYVEANRARWQAGAALPLQIQGAGVPTTDATTGQPSTIATAIRVIDDLYAGFRQAEGQSRRQLRRYNGNFFTTYSFTSGAGWLRDLTVGGGANYRGQGVVGYDTTRNNAPLYGPDYTLVNLMAARNFRMGDKVRVRLQLNVDNLLDEDAPIVVDADQNRAYRVILQTPRRWSLSSTFTF
jgi:outer membrane receptor protein involved in Fe transport